MSRYFLLILKNESNQLHRETESEATCNTPTVLFSGPSAAAKTLFSPYFLSLTGQGKKGEP